MFVDIMFLNVKLSHIEHHVMIYSLFVELVLMFLEIAF